VGNHHTKYGEYLKEKYKGENIEFVGGIYNINKLNNLRYYSNLYFHGHTVGGTNPSLLEAMASGSLLSANDNVFNRHILGDDALYFTTAEEVCQQLKTVHKGNPEYASFVENNTEKINRVYTWERITNQYEAHFKSILGIVTRPSVKVAQKADNIFDYALRMFL
jgi:glycosyltransferase involved in cell wall biosynthesis